MKKIIALISVSIMLHAGDLFSMINNLDSAKKIETKKYTIEVSGSNLRGYVFNVPKMKSICISVWGDFISHQLGGKWANGQPRRTDEGMKMVVEHYKDKKGVTRSITKFV